MPSRANETDIPGDRQADGRGAAAQRRQSAGAFHHKIASPGSTSNRDFPAQAPGVDKAVQDSVAAVAQQGGFGPKTEELAAAVSASLRAPVQDSFKVRKLLVATI